MIVLQKATIVIELINLRKEYDQLVAVDDLNLAIPEGPSRCPMRHAEQRHS